MTPWLALLAFGVIFTIAAAIDALKESAATKWLRIRAHIRRVADVPISERGTLHWKYRKNHDICLEYAHGSRMFRHTLREDASMSMGPIELWRKQAPTGEVDVFVNPVEPDEYFDPRTRGRWKIFGAIGSACVIAASVGQWM